MGVSCVAIALLVCQLSKDATHTHFVVLKSCLLAAGSRKGFPWPITRETYVTRDDALRAPDREGEALHSLKLNVLGHRTESTLSRFGLRANEHQCSASRGEATATGLRKMQHNAVQIRLISSCLTSRCWRDIAGETLLAGCGRLWRAGLCGWIVVGGTSRAGRCF